jgi:SHS2 domain-containing protein
MAEYPQGSFQFIDHTADVGILAKALTLEGLFEIAALAFTELITSVDSLNFRVERQIRLQEDEIETLLVSWLHELLYLMDTEGLIFGRFQVNLRDFLLEATAWGEFFDPKVHTRRSLTTNSKSSSVMRVGRLR